MTHRYRCPECRTRRTDWLSLLAHCDKSRHALCRCGGYHYSHRPGSPYCMKNLWSDFNHAERAGESAEMLLEITADIAFDNPGQVTTTNCPF